ncbi:MAG: lytic murein transglycosylase [Methylobacterium sp.]|jgi:membrane-bound lytic murein transglycosylase B|nr:lytic murein transglycosylase [Methylobacterium sp.]
MRRIGLTRLAIAASLALAKPAIGMEQHPRPKNQAPANAQPAGPNVQAFLASLWNEARQRGIRRETFHAALGNFTPDPAIIALTKKQSEFVQPIWSYLDGAISESRLTRGRSAGERFAGELAAIERKYGVDRRILLGIWGMETNFGSFTGEKDVFRSLATLALHRYRDDFFREELLVALKMLEEGLADRSAMRGSWAGAMGQTQFMPSSFMKYAVDHDGDGVRDLWENIPDALASTANYLASFGWQPGLPWGMEVNVPDGFDLASVEGMQEFSSWAAAGFSRANGSALPRNGKATLWYSAGIRGPAFLVTENYRVIKRYNSSDAYALAVAHLGDRIAGGGSFRAAWPRNDKRLSAAEVKELQRRLIALGHPLGKVDGRIGELSREAIRRQQARLGLPADGYPTLALLQKLRQK